MGNYNQWDTDVKKGILKLDEKLFDVEYIGTTSTSDNFWYSSEIENVIPDNYVDLMIKTRQTMQSLNISNLTETKILLEGDINGYNLSMIYIAFAPENVAYFCGSGNTSLYMFVKNLPESIFKKINSLEFSNRVMEIISKFNVNQRLMVEAILIENEIEYNKDKDANIIARFNEKSILTIKFNDNRVTISGNLSV